MEDAIVGPGRRAVDVSEESAEAGTCRLVSSVNSESSAVEEVVAAAEEEAVAVVDAEGIAERGTEVVVVVDISECCVCELLNASADCGQATNILEPGD